MLAKILFLFAISASLAETIVGKRVDVQLSFRDIPNLDPWDGKSDPVATVFYSRVKNNSYREVGQTSVELNTNKGTWPERFSFDYITPNSEQEIKIEVYDSDYNANDFVGFIELSLTELVNAPNMEIEKALLPRGSGFLKLNAYYVEASKDEPEAAIIAP